MPTIMLAVFYFVTPSIVNLSSATINNRLLILGFIFTYTFLFPIGIIYFLYNRKWIKTLTLKTLADRRLPYFVTTVFYSYISYFLSGKSASLQPTALLLFLTAIVIFIVAIISFWWQISAHSAAMGGAMGAFIIYYHHYNEPSLYYLILFSLFISGLVMSARLKQNAHTLAQVVAGFLIGLSIGIFGGHFLGL